MAMVTTNPMKSVKRMSGVKAPHSGHNPTVKLKREENTITAKHHQHAF